MSLFDHVGFDSRNITDSYRFYSGTMKILELKVLQTSDNLFFISGDAHDPMPFIRICAAHDENAQDADIHPANRLYLKFRAESQAQVEAFYHAALQAGGKDNSAPSYQGPQEMGYFVALVYDPDGNTIEVGVHEPRI
ncbi:VOC family protein [Pseudochrobactrum sp. HB0163]|uniref:VOC family protein n=1 Tax=Pseudochrobactrum sp. HB0163 TaxID=3450708 RepID=UPI003F6DAAC7